MKWNDYTHGYIRGFIAACIIWAMASLFGCARQVGASPVEAHMTREFMGDDVFRRTDMELGITCYVYEGYSRGGIACLPTPKQ